jgi:hypothetical protein
MAHGVAVLASEIMQPDREKDVQRVADFVRRLTSRRARSSDGSRGGRSRPRRSGPNCGPRRLVAPSQGTTLSAVASAARTRALVEPIRGLTPRVSSTVRAAAQPRRLASAAAFEGDHRQHACRHLQARGRRVMATSEHDKRLRAEHQLRIPTTGSRSGIDEYTD